MIKKRFKQIGAWILTASLFLGSVQMPVQAAGNAAATDANLALKATATEDPNGYDATEAGAGFVISKINDGDLSTRWSHKVNYTPWVQLAWETPQTMKTFYVTWQRKNIKSYNLAISNDGETWEEIWSTQEVPTENTVEIKLTEAVTAKYLRLNIREINLQEEGSDMQWKACSIYELEVYADEKPDMRTEAEKIMESLNLTAPVIGDGDTHIDMPEVPDNARIRFCADYEQIIGEDGTIYQPLEARTVKGFYEVIAGESSAKSQEYTVAVPGKYTDDASSNAKPAVIPELQEWHGTSGNFQASSASRIIVGSSELSDTAAEFAKDYEDITGSVIQVINGTRADAKRGDIYLEVTTEDKGLDKEGYAMEIADAIFVEAEQSVGAYYATRSILQILKQTNGSIPKGLVKDYPKFEVRGFSLDVGRKPFDLDTLYEFAKNMSWYKMNNFQVHLSDNLIFMEDYSTLEDAKAQTYAGYRLESGVLNSEGKSATSEDVFYTKNEFRKFIQDSRAIGVGIVPELDMPAHALPFTRAFPEYRTKRETGGSHSYLIDELDLSNPETTEFAKSLWEDYFTGSNPVFDEETVIHIGTDEYHGTEGQEGREQFRQFSADMINFVQESGRTVRMWGSLSNKAGTTPVPSEDVQLNVWNTSYSVPGDMYNLGYDMINTLDGSLYVVPSGTGSRGGYGDYLNTQNLYNNWKANTFGSYTVPAGSDQMLGACFAVWHDNIDTRANGISQYDSFDRFFDALPFLSAKLWGEAEDRNYSDVKELITETGTAPNTNMYANIEFASSTIAEWDFEGALEKDSSINNYDLTGSENVRTVNSDEGTALRLMGKESYVTTPLDFVGNGALLTMKVKRDVGTEGEQILCESKDAFGTYGTYAFKAVQKNTGKVGFSREGYDYSFDYTLPENEWVTLTFQSGQQEVALYVNGKLVDKNPAIYYANHPETELTATIAQRGTAKVATMMVPMGRIGSATNSFKGQIEFVSVATEMSMQGEAVPQSELTASACSEAPTAGNEGPARFALDGNENTFWHSNWGSDISLENGHHWFKVTLETPTVINALTYLPRQDSRNGMIYEYSIEVEKADGSTETVVDHGTWPANNNRKTAEFEPIEAKSVKIQVHDSQGDGEGGRKKHATIAELNLHKPFSFDKTQLESKIAEAEECKEDEYTDMTWNVLAGALEAAQKVAADANSTPEECATAYNQLDAAINGLVTKSTDDRLSDAVKAAEQANADDYAADSFAAYQEAAETAANLPENATEDQKKTAAQALETAKNNLANIGALRTAIQSVTEADLAGCTEKSKEAYNSAVTEANAVIANSAATKAQVKSALDKLNQAARALVDLTALRSAINEVKDRKKEDYTARSWRVFEEALAKANEILTAEAPTQAEVSQAVAALYSADEALTKSEPITSAGMLMIVIDAYSKMNLEGYTADSKAAFEKALQDAKNVRDMQGAEPEAFEAAIADVMAAAAGLKVDVDTSDLEEALQTANDRITTLGNLVSQLEGDFSTEVGNLRKALEDAQKAAQAELNTVKEALEKEAADAKKKAEEAEAAAKKAQQELEAAQKQAAAQKAELDRLAAQAEELRKAAEDARKYAQEAQLRAEASMEQTKFAAGSPSLKSAKSTKKGKVKVTWKKVKDADGYKIVYSQNWDFRNSKSVKVSAKAASKTIGKLKSGKKYFFRIRAYQKVDGKEIYSRTSARKQAKVK